MRKFFMDLVAVLCIVTTISAPCWGISAIVGAAGSVLGSLLEASEGANELAALLAIVTNTETQIATGKESLENLTRLKQHLEDFQENARGVTNFLNKSRYVVYSARDITYFATSLTDFWEYSKEYGYSNMSRCISTMRRGLRLYNSCLQEANFMVNVLRGRGSDGKEAMLSDDAKSSMLRASYENIVRARDAWNGITSAEAEKMSRVHMEAQKFVADELKENGFFDPTNMSFDSSLPTFRDVNWLL